MPFSDLKTLIIPKMFISKINEDYGKGKVPLSRSLFKIIGCSHEIKYPCVARAYGASVGQVYLPSESSIAVFLEADMATAEALETDAAAHIEGGAVLGCLQRHQMTAMMTTL